MSEEFSKAANREDELRRCRQAAVEITTALALTLRDLSPRLQAKFGIDAQLLGLAIAQATSRTAAMSAMAAAGGSLEEAQQLSSQLDQVFNSAVRATE
jgi:hypothetical protein